MTNTSPSIRERRQALKMSQLALAIRAECSPAMIGLLERGYSPGQSRTLKNVHSALAAAEREAHRPVRDGQPMQND